MLAISIWPSNSYGQQITRKTSADSSFTDVRDGQVYETVRYTTTYPDQSKETSIWMTRNLNYRTESSFCYDEDDSKCDTYGRLYTWASAMTACPEGWKLPDDEDWYRLSFQFGGNCSSGQALKSDTTLWKNPNYRGTNSSLFNALPAGTGGGNGGYYGIGSAAIFWSATDRDSSTTWDWKFIRASELQRWYGGKQAKHCVRCIKIIEHEMD